MFSMFRKKNKHVHQLAVGLRTQLCKECRDFQARPCEVDGEPAVFHRWVEEDSALLKLGAFVSPERLKAATRAFFEYNIVPAGGTVTVIHRTFALVERGDGSVAKVKPELVRFTDKEHK